MDRLEAHFVTKVINHSVQYSSPEACTNVAESYFGRVEVAQAYHRSICDGYLGLYINDVAWRANYKRVSQKGRFEALAKLIGIGKSPLRGYQQKKATRVYV